MNFMIMPVVSAVLAMSQPQNVSGQIGAGWSRTSWNNNSNGGRHNSQNNGSVENTYVNGSIGFNSNVGGNYSSGYGNGWSGNGNGYCGWGGMGDGCYGGTTIIVVPYSPFTNTWGNPCYTPQVYSTRGCWSHQGQAWIR